MSLRERTRPIGGARVLKVRFLTLRLISLLPGTLSLSYAAHKTSLCLPFLNGHLNNATGFKVNSGRGSMSSNVSNMDRSQSGTSAI